MHDEVSDVNSGIQLDICWFLAIFPSHFRIFASNAITSRVTLPLRLSLEYSRLVARVMQRLFRNPIQSAATQDYMSGRHEAGMQHD